MKFLWYADWHVPGATSELAATALERAGHTVCRWGRNGGIGFNLKALVACAEFYRVDCVIVTGGSEFRDGEFGDLRDMLPGRIFSTWTWDWMHRDDVWPWFAPIAAACDVAFTSDGSDDPAWVAAGINRVVVRDGVAPWLHEPKASCGPERVPRVFSDERYQADVAFVGNLYENGGRRAVMESVAAFCRDSGLTFKTWGHDTEFVHGDTLAAVVYGTDILLGHDWAHEVGGIWSSRVYHILRYGGFFLAQKTAGLDTEFIDGMHLVMWDGVFDLMRKIAYWRLPDSKRDRQQIEWAGMEYVHDVCTYDRRIETVLETLKKLGG